LIGCGSSGKPELHLYIWSDAIDPSLLKKFEEKYACRIVVDTYDSNEALISSFPATI
jgi:spermidine/putrescine transport system substrate-binding protein